MYWTTILTIMALPAALGVPNAEHWASKRGSGATGVTLYAYGVGISGIPLLYGTDNGYVYINSGNDSSSSLASVTWDIPSLLTATTTSTNASLANGTTPGAMNIHPDNGLYDQVNVVSDSEGSANGTTTGITTYGQQLIYYDGSSLQAEFWARPGDSLADGTSVWTLLWNSDNESRTGATPVTIKTVAPAAAS